MCADVDDALGNFSLTLVDTLDTLVVVGEFDEFERAVQIVVDTVRFDSDLVVSVFETSKSKAVNCSVQIQI